MWCKLGHVTLLYSSTKSEKIFKKKVAHFLARVILLNWYKKIENISRYKTALSNFEMSHLF